jgi:hypothetical protein
MVEPEWRLKPCLGDEKRGFHFGPGILDQCNAMVVWLARQHLPSMLGSAWYGAQHVAWAELGIGAQHGMGP